MFAWLLDQRSIHADAVYRVLRAIGMPAVAEHRHAGLHAHFGQKFADALRQRLSVEPIGPDRDKGMRKTWGPPTFLNKDDAARDQSAGSVVL